MANCGMPCRKLVVPSSGSMCQRWVLSGALDDARLLHDEAVVRPRLLQRVAQDLLGLAVGGGDEVAGALARDLQVLDLAEIALERARRLHHGVGHDGHQGGADHRRVRPRARGLVKPG